MAGRRAHTQPMQKCARGQEDERSKKLEESLEIMGDSSSTLQSLDEDSDEDAGFVPTVKRLSARDRRYIDMAKRPKGRMTADDWKRVEHIDKLRVAHERRRNIKAAEDDTEDDGLDDPASDEEHETLEQRRRRRIARIARENRRIRKEHEANGTLRVYKPLWESTSKRLPDGSYIEIDPKTRRCVGMPCVKKPDPSFWDLRRSRELEMLTPRCEKCEQVMDMTAQEALKAPDYILALPSWAHRN